MNSSVNIEKSYYQQRAAIATLYGICINLDDSFTRLGLDVSELEAMVQELNRISDHLDHTLKRIHEMYGMDDSLDLILLESSTVDDLLETNRAIRNTSRSILKLCELGKQEALFQQENPNV